MPEDLWLPFDVRGGYWPSASLFPPEELQNTIRAGNGMWLRPQNRVQTSGGPIQTSATNVGARIFPANDARLEIAGGLVSNRLPFAGAIRLAGDVYLFLSELTSQQVYRNETALSGVTTSSTAGMLRVAIPDGSGGYNVYDAGFDPPVLPAGNVTTPAGGTLAMPAGTTAVALCAWRTKTNAVSAPSKPVVATLAAGDTILIDLVTGITAASGQDGWVYAGTAPGDITHPLKVIRYVRITPRGTFTATNGSVNLTAGVGTFFLEDLRVGDIVTINAASYTIATVTSQTTATLTANFAGTTGSGKTMTVTSANAEWLTEGRGDLIENDVFKPVRAAGLVEFMNRVLLFGCDQIAGGTSPSTVTGPAIFALLPNNPEHIGLFNISTTDGADILNAAPYGDNRSNNLFMMTRTGLEIVTLSDDGEYRVRVKHQPGFRTAKAGAVYKDVFYGFAQRPFRTRIESDTDVEFGIPVFSDMALWNPDRILVMVDPKNEAILYAHYDGSTNTTVIPYMEQLLVWGPPLTVGGQIVDWAIVSGVLYIVVLSGGNYRVQEWEAGNTGVANTFIATQYLHRPFWMKVKGWQFVGANINFIRFYLATTASTPNVNNTAAASFSKSYLTGTTNDLYPSEFTNLQPAKGIALRFDFFTANTSEFQKMLVRYYPLESMR